MDVLLKKRVNFRIASLRNLLKTSKIAKKLVKRVDYAPDDLQRAFEEVKNGDLTLRDAEEMYEVPMMTISESARGKV